MCRVLILCLVLFTTGCAGSLCFVQTRYDEFEGYTISRMINNSLGGSDFNMNPESVGLNIQKVVSKGGCESISLMVIYADYSDDARWLFISNGESLVLLIDGKRIGLVGEGSGNYRDVLPYGSGVIERAWYPVSREIIHTISNAKEVKVRLIGSKGFIERYFVQANFNNFKKFVESYLPIQ